ncbi:MAG: flavin reductase family protein [Pseudomonadota bacterium]
MPDDIPSQSIAEPQLLTPESTELRRALGQFATGVCIVSAPPIADEADPFAITVSSFASVSLTPPMILWCVQKLSTTYQLWMDSPQFGVSVLNANQRDLCDRYAVRGNHAMHEPSDYRLSARGTPLIPDAVATFDCQVNAIHDAGDHSLILADVLAFDADESTAPLIYVRGGIHG